VSDAPVELDELVDLKMLPAWVNEPAPTERYAGHEGEDLRERRSHDRRPRDKRDRIENVQGRVSIARLKKGKCRSDRFGRIVGLRVRRIDFGKIVRGLLIASSVAVRLALRSGRWPPIAVKFLPRVSAFEKRRRANQVRPRSRIRYSHWRGFFWRKRTRHDVQLAAPPESPLFQLAKTGDVSVDRQFLERNAFRIAQADFYKVDITEMEPIKGNFTNVARCRLSGTLLGPTNHHDLNLA